METVDQVGNSFEFGTYGIAISTGSVDTLTENDYLVGQ